MSSQFKKRIMRKIYAIWFMKRVAPVIFLQMPFLIFVAFRETAREFFVAKVVENFLLAFHGSGFAGVSGFTASAIRSAPVLPVSIVLLSLVLFVILGYRLTKSLRELYLVKSPI